jgi:hypothetical protein
MAKDEDDTFIKLPFKNLRKSTPAPLRNWHVSYAPLKIKLKIKKNKTKNLKILKTLKKIKTF